MFSSLRRRSVMTCASPVIALPWRLQPLREGWADDDTFYVGGWNQDILYHVKGLSYPDKGAVISQCSPPDGNISGLAWNPAAGIVWAATNTATDTVYQLDPRTCAVLGTLAHPSPGFDGAGLEMDELGNLWMIDQDPNTVYLIDSGVPAFNDVPWLSENPTVGTLAPGASQEIEVQIDTAGLEPGIYIATLRVLTNSGRQPVVSVPVRLLVPAYQQGVDAAASTSNVDGPGDTWSPDQAYSPGGWGYTEPGHEVSTKRSIGGTEDDVLYHSARRDPASYRFDGLPDGTYAVELRFAEIANLRPGLRVVDVQINGDYVLVGYDVAASVGRFTADDHDFDVEVSGGTVEITFLPRRGLQLPIVNAIRVTERPDR